MKVSGILREVFWNSLDAIVVTDKNAVIVNVNPAYEAVSGYSREELIGRRTNIVRSGLTPPEVFREMWDHLTTRGKWVGEIINRRKDGSLWYCYLTITRVVDETGETSAYVGIARDISQQKALEHELRQSLLEIQAAQAAADVQAYRLRAMLQSVDEAIIMVDTLGLCVIANRNMEDVLGIPIDQIIGKSIHELRAIGARVFKSSGVLRWEPAPDGGPPRETETNVVETRGEKPRFFQEFAAPVIDEAEQVIGRIYIYRDITKLTEVDRMKSEFIAAVSHELRTPMTSIKGSLGLVLGGAMGELPEEVRDLLTIAQNNSDRLIRLINDILDISRIEAGKMEIRPEPLEPSEAIRRAILEMDGFARQRSIRLIADLPEGLPRVMADADRLQQVLVNLISNAVKFSPPGTEVKIWAEAEPGGVVFHVTDQGPGIPEHQQAMIFEKFSRIDNAASRRTGGTGLGLAICKALVEEHGGRIWVESRVGHGSTFSFSLPAEPHPAEPALPESPAGRRVLVVDDDPDIVRLISLSLEQHGFQTIGATSGEQALQIARSQRVDAITLDLLMPGIHGLEVARRLKEDPATRHIPVIIISAYTAGHQPELLALGVAGVIAKPIDEEKMLRAIRSVLGDPPASGTPTILVVDDDQDVRRIVTVMLERAGYGVRTASDGQEAYRMITEERPDVLILDLMMPNLDGFQLVKLLRQRPWTQKIPLLVLTALDLTERDRRLLQLGPTQHVTKGPLIQQIVVEKVRELLEEKERGRA